MFEIVSFAILKSYYYGQPVYFGLDQDSSVGQSLQLCKTGRTKAHDDGLDFVMKSLGRFFQVTETLDVRKDFLDVDKIEKHPLSFVIKSDAGIAERQRKLAANAKRLYPVEIIVSKYWPCAEEYD